MKKTTTQIGLNSIYRELLAGNPAYNYRDIEHLVLEELKSRFEEQGIRFLDKPGLYPEPPARVIREDIGHDRFYTITQERS